VGGGGLMTIGQMSEIIVLALIPLVARKISRKNLLALGIVAYALRMFLFAYVDSIGLPPMITLIAGVALHGVCFGCFVFVAFMVVDEQTTPDVRASAQSLFGLVIFGVGIIVGSIVAGYVGDWAKSSGAMDYQRLFSVPMWAAIVCLALMLALYPAGRRMKDEDSMAREM
jgi:MFS family permease